METNNAYEEIRSDLWNTMDASQLIKQRELLLNNITQLCQIGHATTPSILNLHSALQQGLSDINKLIDNKFSSKKTS